MNITFISLTEANNVYFMSGEAKYEIYFFLASRDEINGIFMTKICIFFLLYTILKGTATLMITMFYMKDLNKQ